MYVYPRGHRKNLGHDKCPQHKTTFCWYYSYLLYVEVALGTYESEAVNTVIDFHKGITKKIIGTHFSLLEEEYG